MTVGIPRLGYVFAIKIGAACVQPSGGTGVGRVDFSGDGHASFFFWGVALLNH